MFFLVQNHSFLCSRCIDAVKKLNKSCKKNIIFDRKIIIFIVKNQRVSPKNLQKSFIFHSKHIFFLQRSATRSVHVSEKELQRSPELRGAKNLYERKPTPSNPGVGKTVARERYTLNRLHRKATRKKAAGRQCTTAI